jgi:cell division protein FtsB
MPRTAVALAAPDSELNAQLTELRRQIGYGRGFRPSRSQVLLVGLLILGFWLLLTFGRSLAQLNEAGQREAAMTAETKALEAELDAGRRELTLIQTDAFQALQARALGYGENGEIAFTLPADAPSHDHIAPLGAATAGAQATQTPLEAWLDLLFGN